MVRTDLQNQVGWLADEGFVAAGPDLHKGRRSFRCVMSLGWISRTAHDPEAAADARARIAAFLHQHLGH
jgi:dienelactone hydrolase